MHAQHTRSNADIIIVVVVVFLFFIFLILMWISIDLDFGVCLKENFFTQKKEKGKKKKEENLDFVTIFGGPWAGKFAI